MRAARLVAPLASLALAAGCSFGDLASGHAEAQKAVDEFHARLNEGRAGEIYDAASDELHRSAARQRFVDLLEAVRRKLGKVTGTKNEGWQVNARNLKTYVELTQATRFERGEAHESFVFQVRDGKAHLLRYDIRSDELIMR